MKYICIYLIKLYQKIPGPWHNSCKFKPTCSNYAIGVLEEFGFLLTVSSSVLRKSFSSCSSSVPMKHDNALILFILANISSVISLAIASNTSDVLFKFKYSYILALLSMQIIATVVQISGIFSGVGSVIKQSNLFFNSELIPFKALYSIAFIFNLYFLETLFINFINLLSMSKTYISHLIPEETISIKISNLGDDNRLFEFESDSDNYQEIFKMLGDNYA